MGKLGHASSNAQLFLVVERETSEEEERGEGKDEVKRRKGGNDKGTE